MVSAQKEGNIKVTQHTDEERFSSFSLLMSVYYHDDANYLNSSLNSIISQTCPPSEIVLVKDGPLKEACDKVISDFQLRYNATLTIIALEKNVGLGHALRAGLDACTYELVARMDADDICEPDRFEIQLKYFEENPETDVLSSYIGEFDTDEKKIITIRKVPLEPGLIIKKARYRNPINHMAVMFKKTPVLSVGSYNDFLWFQDYYLWARLLKAGYRFANVPNVLIRARAGNELFQRRGGWEYLKQEMLLQKEFLKMGFINFPIFVFNVFIRSLVRIMPNTMRASLYGNYLRHS